MEQPSFDSNAKSIAERKIKAALAARLQRFAYTVAELHSQFVKAGAIGGSAHQQVIRDACRTELRERFQVGWEILRSIAIDFNLPRTSEVGARLKALINHLVIDWTPDLAQAIALSRRQSGEHAGQTDVATLIEQVLPEVEADVELFITAPIVRSEHPGRGEELEVDRRKIFLSHAAVDAPQANLLKEEIERRMPGLSIFCSSYPGDIILGFRWSAEIQHNLRQAGALMLVATSRSIGRPWVWFESGAFWFNRPIVICCIDELRADNLPPPLGERQAVTVATAKDLEVLLESLSTITGISVADKTDLRETAELLAELVQKANLRSDMEHGWVAVPWENKFLICDGPIEELNLIDAEYYQESMLVALKGAGFRLSLVRRDQIGECRDRGMKQVYVTDKRKWRKEVVKGEMILVAQSPSGQAESAP